MRGSLRQGVGPGNGEIFVLLHAGGAADANPANDLTVDDDRNATLEGRKIIQSRHVGFIEISFKINSTAADPTSLSD